MRIYYDTEFGNLDGNLDWDMVSAGFVAENGEEFYVEITDFLRENCTPFVVEVVLPLLGKGDRIPERMPGCHFGWRLCNWLAQFGENIELVSDNAVDWQIVFAYAYGEFAAQPYKVQGQVWLPNEALRAPLQAVETGFWQANPGMQHHALYDARGLKAKAERQRQLLDAGK